MKSIQVLKNQYAQWTNNSTAANLSQGQTYINDSVRTICNMNSGKWRWLESTKDILTVANQRAYQVPNGFRKIIDMYVTMAGNPSTPTVYMPIMIFDPTIWKQILAMNLGTSDWPYYTYVQGNTVQFAPIPGSSGNIITFRGRLQNKELTMNDYTTGTIVSVANGGTAVVGSGTSWTQDMVGRYIQITETQAANGGDGYWYEIGGWTNATNITLLKPYEGTDITAGSAAYTIGQMSNIPEAYDIAPAYRAAALYWQNQNDLVRAKTYWMQYDGGVEAGYTRDYGGIMLQMMENEMETEEGGFVRAITNMANVIQAPYYLPYQQATGFS